MLMVVATVVPLVALLGLGAWFIGQVQQAGSTIAESTLWMIVIAVAVVTVVVVAFAAWRIRAAMRGRVMDLTDICRQISMGRREVRVPVLGDDEFSLLGATLNAVLDGAPAPTAAGASKGAVVADTQDAAMLQAQIEKLLQEVSAVGDGDLRVQAEVTPDTLGVLADSFNYMIEELAKVVGRVQATTLQVTNATRRLLDRSAEVAQASEGQSQQIAQTSEAVARLADFVQLSANNALLAAEAAREAIRNAHQGQQAVVQTIDGMVHIRENVQETSKKIKRLGERSQEVGEIVRLIEDIADQTNLLALNAAIQSAMAGEHGRGFAVVADEIRVLAERVTEATKRIATIVKSIQGDTYEAVVAMEESTQEVVNGSRLADEAGRSLGSIYGAVERQAQMIEGIAQAAGDRKQTAEAVAMAMNQIADITRQTNAATQDTTTSVSYLAELAEQLRASVATFRLPDQIAEAAGLMPQGQTGYLGGEAALPSLGAPAWGTGMQALPALPAGPAVPVGSQTHSGLNGLPSEFDLGGFGGGYAPSSQMPPDFGQPNFGQPNFGQPNFGQPNFGQPDYGQPEYNGQGAYGQPSYGQPGYGQGSYGQPDYNGQGYGPGGYGQPEYGPEAYPPPVPAQPPQQQQQQSDYPDQPFFSGPLGDPPF
jgi:methyl-accepting chemotaxis protein